MKDCFIRPPTVGRTVRGSKKKPCLPDTKAKQIPNSDEFYLFPVSSPSQISSLNEDLLVPSTDSTIAVVGDLEEVESSSTARSLFLDNTDNPSDLPVLTLESSIELPGADEEEISSNALAPFMAEVAEAEEIFTESSEAPDLTENRIMAEQGKTEEKGGHKLESVIIGFSRSVEALEDAIRGRFLPSLDQRKRDGKRKYAMQFYQMRLTEVTLGCVLGAFLLPVIIIASDLAGWLIWKPSEFYGPSPT
ncbi:hypothetical protein HPP92_024965 [Vanilla planifolia]|uniref:Uncharacterized protein n=1 Tax=Vanilla planifolia TaxID=51239 RepID=A0A835PK27_VANPL|nr:hypothetical protein HPP92_024965 [Vanilla planifolia]